MSSSALNTAGSTAPHSFKLTSDQEQLRDVIRKFSAREIAPHVMEWDEVSEFPAAVVKQLGEMGLMGIIFPEEYGGTGLGYTDYMMAVEELSAVDGSVSVPTTFFLPATSSSAAAMFRSLLAANGSVRGG
jgi:alkylation response protein AidB-like acyl-CoA dehydrogenase